MKKHRESQEQKYGFTLTELAIVLGVIGLIIGAIWYAAGNVNEVTRANNAVTQMQTVAQNVMSIVNGSNTALMNLEAGAGAEITSQMITANAIPASYVNAAYPTEVDNPWSTSSSTSGVFKVFVITNAATPGKSKEFRVSFYGVTYKGCLNLLQQATACQVGQIGCPAIVMTALSADKIPATGYATNWATQLTSASASTLCSDNTYPGVTGNSVEFDFLTQ